MITRLELEGRPPIENPDSAAIEDALARVGTEGSTFATLSRDDVSYIQTAIALGEGFLLEYQEGSLEAHFRCPQILPRERVVEAFQKYARGDESWRAPLAWEKQDLVAGPAKAGGCLATALLLLQILILERIPK